MTATRAAAELDYLTTLLDSMRAGTLTDEQMTALEELATAWDARNAAAEADRLTALAAERTRRNRTIDLAIVAATGSLQGVTP